VSDQATIPVLWCWEGERDWWAADGSTSEDHGAGIPDGQPPAGDGPGDLYWLQHRRDRWMHDAQVRG
jgi:hypothetical protein